MRWTTLALCASLGCGAQETSEAPPGPAAQSNPATPPDAPPDDPAPPADATPQATRISDYPAAPHEDRHGNLWFATAFDGVLRHDGSEFVAFTTEQGLASNTVRGVMEDEDGTLWFATGGGLSRYDGESFTTLTEYEGSPLRPGFGEHGHHRDLWDVMRDRRGRLWIATMDGVFLHDGEAFRPYPLAALDTEHPFEFTPRMVYTIFEDEDGALWFGTDGAGAVRDDGRTQTVFNATKGLCGDHVCAILRDRRGLLWFGTSGGGVSRFDGKAFTTHLRYPTFQDHGVGWGRFLAVFEDRAGDVWFGVSGPGGGVHRDDGASFRYYSVDDGLGEGGIIDIGEDRGGTLWIGSTSGVFRREGDRFVPFTREG